MNNKLYFLSKFLNRNGNLFITISAILVVFANLCMLSEHYLIGCTSYLFITTCSLFRFGISNIELDKDQIPIPSTEEVITIKKTFFYDGEFRSFINTTDPSRKPNFHTIKKDSEWTLYSIVEEKDDWMLYMEDKHRIRISIKYFETQSYWETKSDRRADRLKQLGI
jgi:hypothetical protein